MTINVPEPRPPFDAEADVTRYFIATCTDCGRRIRYFRRDPGWFRHKYLMTDFACLGVPCRVTEICRSERAVTDALLDRLSAPNQWHPLIKFYPFPKTTSQFL